MVFTVGYSTLGNAGECLYSRGFNRRVFTIRHSTLGNARECMYSRGFNRRVFTVGYSTLGNARECLYSRGFNRRVFTIRHSTRLGFQPPGIHHQYSLFLLIRNFTLLLLFCMVHCRVRNQFIDGNQNLCSQL